MPTKLKKLRIDEISLVDRGSNPHAFITLFKRDAPKEIEVPRDSDRSFNATGRGKMHDLLWTAYDNRRRALGPGRDPHAFAQAWDALTDDQKDAIRAEEKATEAAKEAAEAAEQKEREREMMKTMNDSKLEEIVKLAHDVDAGRMGNHADRAAWYGAITKAAETQRKPTESSQQSFARFITEDADGKVMFKCYQTSAGSDYVPPAPVVPVAKATPSRDEINKIADEFVTADPSLTKYSALLKVHRERPELLAKAKTEAFA